MALIVQNVIYTRASRPEVGQVIQQLPDLASGRMARGMGILAQALAVRLGLEFLGRIKDAFIQKSQGQTDEAGERWQPLDPKTIAYSRRHRYTGRVGQRKLVQIGQKGGKTTPLPSVRAGYAPSWALTDKQRKRWWNLYRRGLGIYGISKDGKSHAAAVAWMILKNEGAQTIMAIFGHAKVDILRDKGLLLNSLSPGVRIGQPLPPVPPPKPKDQVFRYLPGEVIIGTNRAHAGTHHRGIPGKLPQRRLWPPPSKWPSSWWNAGLKQVIYGVIDIARFFLRN